MSVPQFDGWKIFYTARLLKNMILDLRKISGNLGMLHLQQLKVQPRPSTYEPILWSQNNFLIDIATSLCKMVGMTFESHDLSGNCVSPTLCTGK